jgi:hypothetical protein
VSRYATGSNLERELINEFKALGWYCIRSAGSKGVIDVVAANYGQTYLFQLKRNVLFKPELERICESGIKIRAKFGKLSYFYVVCVSIPKRGTRLVRLYYSTTLDRQPEDFESIEDLVRRINIKAISEETIR